MSNLTPLTSLTRGHDFRVNINVTSEILARDIIFNVIARAKQHGKFQPLELLIVLDFFLIGVLCPLNLYTVGKFRSGLGNESRERKGKPTCAYPMAIHESVEIVNLANGKLVVRYATCIEHLRVHASKCGGCISRTLRELVVPTLFYSLCKYL